MLNQIRLRLMDMKTLKTVLETSEARARADGVAEPGAEHLVMAALDLPEDTARRAFERVGADPAGFVPAVARQFDEALAKVGVEAAGSQTDPHALPGEGTGVFRSQPSARTLMERLARDRPLGSSRPLTGADVVLAALGSDVGTVARALAVMGVDREALVDVCRREIAAHRPSR